ncbi:MAG: hypothetical protein JXA77_05920 [Bacteroidales bacterium]|nr:hypothetical protein [Bacteroidales bacterium]MBN2820575.1 hypothetical protein [Bacteroidales bacterium]
MKKILLAGLTIILCYSVSYGQEEECSLRLMPTQVTFFYPVGMFGLKAQDYSYLFSLNMLAGRTGGVDGFEVGGLININDCYMKGFQAAGIGNINAGFGDGFQSAGIFNIVEGKYNGFQSAGIFNITGGFCNAVQAAGIYNFSSGLNGAQFSGIASISDGKTSGMQCSGILSIATKSSGLAQISGIANASDSIKGIQIGGIVNIAENIDGAQIGGIINMADDVDGAQIGGIINVASNVKGLQLAGIINICDSINGIPLALFSYVRKNGYRKFEISTNEFTPVNITYKTGVKRFYTQFSLGYNNSIDNDFTYGFGLGTVLPLKNSRSSLNFVLNTTQFFRYYSDVNYTQLYSLSADYSINILNKFEVFAGPRVNFLYSSRSYIAARFAPEWGRAFEYDNRWWGWIGYHAGIRF